METNTNIYSTLFKVGHHVEVDGILLGWITRVYGGDSIEDMLLEIKYDGTNDIETDVSTRRVKVTTFDPNPASTTRSGRIRDNSVVVGPPPPLSPLTTSPSPNSVSNNTETISPDQHSSIIESTDTIYECIKECYSWRKYKSTNKLYCYLRDGLQKRSGWLRDIFSRQETNPKTHLSKHESNVLTVVSGLFSGYRNDDVEVKDHCKATRHAFAISISSHKAIMHRCVDSSFTLQRKKRSDSNQTVFNSEKKRKAVFTALNAYKKKRNTEFRETTARIPNSILKDGFNALPQSEKDAYSIIAERECERAGHLWEELKELLLKTKGKVSYKTMANHLNNLVSENTIRCWLQQQDGFCVRKDRILPSLDKQAKTRRLKWSHDFWVFWYYTKFVKKEKAIFVLTHMDEKWFYNVKSSEYSASIRIW